MADKEMVKIILKNVFIKKNATIPGSGEAWFSGTLAGGGQLVQLKPKGAQQPDKTARKLRAGGTYKLGWEGVIDVTNNVDEITIKVECHDADATKSQNHGTVTEKLTWPYRQDQSVISKPSSPDLVKLQYEVQLSMGGKFGRHKPKSVFACRQNIGSATATSVSGGKTEFRIEFHPVRPSPTRLAELPKRPPRMNTSGKEVSNNGSINIKTNSPPNIMPNPPVIPILDSKLATKELKKKAAKIQFTWYYPKSMNFEKAGSDLTWEAQALSGSPTVKFVGKAEGLKIMCYGTGANEGTVLLKLKYKDTEVAQYRALVRKPKQIKSRFTLLKVKNRKADSPTSKASDIKKHIAVTNALLWQVGLELALDTDTSVKDSAKRIAEGVFEIEVPKGKTQVTSMAAGRDLVKLNYRAKVLNFVYIKSFVLTIGTNKITALGAALAIPDSNEATHKMKDTGSPSSSWVSNSGVDYEVMGPPAPADPVEITMFPKQGTGPNDLWGMFITDANPSAKEFANTIAHEMGHVLNLRHRVGAGDDGVGHPKNENLMHGSNPATLAQDLDIVQAMAVIKSKLF